jgi:hypothetical protein
MRSLVVLANLQAESHYAAEAGGSGSGLMTMTPGKLRLRAGDVLAIVVLSLGCIIGLVGLMVRPPKPQALPVTTEQLHERVRELERRMLDQVPKVIEQRYGDL